MLGSVTLAFALTQPFRGVTQHLANGVDLAHRQLTCSDRLALPERGCLRSKRTHRTCHSVADGIGEQHREDREQERDRSRVFLNTVIDNVPATVIVKDAQTLRYALVNKAGEKYFALPKTEIIGKTSEDLFPPEAAAGITATDLQLVKSGESFVSHEHPITTPDGQRRIVSTSRSPIRDPHGNMHRHAVTMVKRSLLLKIYGEGEIPVTSSHHQGLRKLPPGFRACATAPDGLVE